MLRGLFMDSIYEVRIFNVATNKNVPGTRVHSGKSYREARKFFDSYKPKYGVKAKLQAVTVMKSKINSVETVKEEFDKAVERAQWTPEETEAYKQKLRENSNKAPRGTFILESSSPNAAGMIVSSEHDCNFSGAMTYRDGTYISTCSICGAPAQ